jgi:hypothetical protein
MTRDAWLILVAFGVAMGLLVGWAGSYWAPYPVAMSFVAGAGGVALAEPGAGSLSPLVILTWPQGTQVQFGCRGQDTVLAVGGRVWPLRCGLVSVATPGGRKACRLYGTVVPKYHAPGETLRRKVAEL